MAIETIAGARPSLKRRSRQVACGIALLVVVAMSVELVRVTSLRGLPAIDDPFDTRGYATIVVPDEENAFTFFRRATDRFVGHESDIPGGSGVYNQWSEVPPETLRSLEQNRETLELWREGTTRNRALYIQPAAATILTVLPVTQRLRSFSRLASLRAMRLRLDGDLAGAWDWIRANLRCGMLSGHEGFVIERLMGISIYAGASADAIRWADDPKVEVTLLRRALDDVLGMEAIAPRYTSIVRHEYYMLMNSLADPEMLARGLEDLTPVAKRTWRTDLGERMARVLAVLRREPERTRRVGRLVIANWLAACDQPTDERTRRLVQLGALTLFRPTPDEPSPIAPEELARWFETTIYAKIFFSVWKNIEGARNRDERTRAGLVVHLAERLYRKEHGSDPPSPDALVGPYLKTLPEGFVRPPTDSDSQGSPR